jgi:hypothetical protein
MKLFTAITIKEVLESFLFEEHSDLSESQLASLNNLLDFYKEICCITDKALAETDSFFGVSLNDVLVFKKVLRKKIQLLRVKILDDVLESNFEKIENSCLVLYDLEKKLSLLEVDILNSLVRKDTKTPGKGSDKE